MKALVDPFPAVPTVGASSPAVAAPAGIADQLVSLLAPASAVADRYRSLRYSIEALRSEAGLPVVAVTSPDTGDGKTVTVLNLAGAFAQAEGARVLVVDADLRKPSVSHYLGLDSRLNGLSRALRNPGYELEAIAHRLDPFNLWIVPAGTPDPAPCELLNSPTLAALIGEARRSFDCVLIDTPPALLPDCRLIGRWVDGFMLVVTAHKTSRKLLGHALDELGSARLFGVVFNGDETPTARYYGYYQADSHDRPSAPPRNRAWWHPPGF
jgi:capsular exopolysaccharide synthesis family protein